MPTLRELGEVEAIRRLTGARRGPGVVVPSGDDAAVLRPAPGLDLVATTDTCVEGRHFLPGWSPPAEVGRRLAVANLSDLAAMAAAPRWALLSIGARPSTEVEALIVLQRGLEETLAGDGAAVVGGNLTAVEGVEWFALTLLGEVAPGGAWTRAGGRAGDRLAVTGSPGRAGAGVRLAQALGDRARAAEFAPLLDAWLAPSSRVALARALASTGAVRAAIDLSDGLAGDLARLSEASGVGAELDEAAFPDDPALARAAQALDVSELALRTGASDDYELLLAVAQEGEAACAAAARAAGVPLAFIGTLAGPAGVLALRGRDGRVRPLPGAGYDPFSGTAS